VVHDMAMAVVLIYQCVPINNSTCFYKVPHDEVHCRSCDRGSASERGRDVVLH